MEISKELIKNVLAKETEYLSDDFTFSIEDNYILFIDEGESQFEVNIYEFSFKCKEWLNIKGYSFRQDNVGYTAIRKNSSGKFKIYNEEDFNIEIAIKRIFQCCNIVIEGEI